MQQSALSTSKNTAPPPTKGSTKRPEYAGIFSLMTGSSLSFPPGHFKMVFIFASPCYIITAHIIINLLFLSNDFTILIAQALQRLYPENEKGIWSSVAIDARKALGCPFSRYNNAYVIFLKEDPSILEGDYEKLGVMTRGQIIVQSEECNLRAIHNIITGLSLKISQAGTEEERFGYFMEIYKNVAGNPTYILSYIGNPEWGGLEPYIERVYSIILPDRLAVEINSAGGKFCVCWMQTFTGDKYVRAFKAALDGINVDCELSGPYPYPFTKCEIQ